MLDVGAKTPKLIGTLKRVVGRFVQYGSLVAASE
jgi:hypothetical protein